MRPLEVRISYLISVGVVLLLAAVFWLAYGRYVLLEATEDDFSSLQKVARIGRLAADVGSSLPPGRRRFASMWRLMRSSRRIRPTCIQDLCSKR